MSNQMTKVTIFVTCFFLALNMAVPVSAETMSDAIALAYQSNPTLMAQRATQRALDETHVQAEAGYRATGTMQVYVTTDTNNQVPTLQVLNGEYLTSGQTQTSGATLSITQPLYTGGQVSRQVDAADAKIFAGREVLRQTELSLLQAVAQAYVDVRRDLESVTVNQANVELLRSQREEAEAKFEVGNITKTDVLQTEVRLTAAQAQLSSAEAQLGVSRGAYAAVVGQSPGSLSPEPSLTALLPASLEAAVAAAERESPRLRQADYEEKASHEQILVAKSQTHPNLGLQARLGYAGGNYGVQTPFANYTHDVTVSLVGNFPLFTGGAASSQIREAIETDSAKEIAIAITRRQVVQDVTKAWSQLVGARASRESDEKQVGMADLTLRGVQEEARGGLRTNLDTLIAEQDDQNARLSLIAARHDEFADGIALLVAMGTLSVEDLSRGTPAYDPRRHLEELDHRWNWAPWEPIVSAIDRVRP